MSSKYVELHARSAFSFLEGASLPEELISVCAELKGRAMALLDRDGLYGAPRFHLAAKKLGVKAHIGAEITLALENGHGSRSTATLPLLVESRAGYQNLCRLITLMKLRAPKHAKPGEVATTLDELAAHAEGLICLTGGDDGPLAYALRSGPNKVDESFAITERLVDIFGKNNVYAELQRHFNREEEARNQAVVDLAGRSGLPLLATNGVSYASAARRQLADVLTCIRNHAKLETAGRLLAKNSERFLKPPSAMWKLFGDKNAFQVKVLPADADPMDLRYNMINWVHRSTRGWSYGGSVTDPRTGEIIKGNVTLGSLRDRQDYLIGSGLIPLFAMNGKNDGEGECELASSPDPDYLADLDPSTNSAAMALARLRQLSAHETGHTLGLAHNFAASTYGRASVMDYPAPTVEIKNGKLDLSNAYAAGIGAYDKFAIKFGYSEFAPGANEQAELERIIEEGVAAGMLFISDADARPPGAAHPLASLWDNGADPIAELRHEMEVRRIGLSQFGLGNIPTGTPLSVLEAKLLPLYLHHRYQLQAAVKSVGGVYYTYAVKTASGANPGRVQEIVSPARQREALAAVLETIKVDALAMEPRILDLIPPRAFGYEGGTAELFSKQTDPTFDPISAATIAADLAVSGLLEPHRAARLLEFHSRNNANPDFKEAVDALINSTWKVPSPRVAYHAEIARAVQSLAVNRLMELAANPDASPQVRAVATQGLRELSAWLKLPASAGMNAAHRSATREDIERFLARPDATRKQSAPPTTPPGDPIGAKGSKN